jgi:serine protease Do
MNIRWMLTRVLVVILVITCIQPNFNEKEASAETVFPDVTNFRSEISYLTQKGIINGYSNGHFGPNDSLLRVQAVLMIMRELGVSLKGAPDPGFVDVNPNKEGYKEISKAYQLGIISGVGNNKFNPYGVITRAEMAKILAKAYSLKGTYSEEFKDVRQNYWAYSYVQALAAHSITAGFPDGSFRPSQKITRAQFAAFMARYLNDKFKPQNYSAPTYSLKEMLIYEQSVVMIELYDEFDELVSQGSGFIIANQLIATNLHVVSGGMRAVAFTSNGEEIPLQGVVDYNEYFDLALLKPVEKLGLPALQLLPYDLVDKGEDVVAIGSPLGFQNSFSKGIVSGKRVFQDELGEVKTIQTTTHITHGSSGGPLLNMKGFVVGVNTFGIETINFAIASDYLYDMVTKFINIDFKNLPLKDFGEMPLFEEETGQSPDQGSNSGEIITPEQPNRPIEEITPVASSTALSDLFLDVVHHTELPIIYGVNEDGDVVSFNYETNEKKYVSFTFPAERIYFANGDVFVTLLKGNHNSYAMTPGAVAILDGSTLKTKNVYNIDIDPYDIVADENYFYVSSGSSQWTYIKSYQKDTGLEISSNGIRQQSRIEFHPEKNRIYTTDSDSSPRDMEVYFVNNGVFSTTYDTPYHGDYRLAETFTISPDGKYIFNHAGSVFRSTNLQTTNMKIVTDLGLGTYTGVSFNIDLAEFYTVAGNTITVFDYTTFFPTGMIKIKGKGSYLFNHNGNIIVVGEEIPANSNILRTFVSKIQVQ